MLKFKKKVSLKKEGNSLHDKFPYLKITRIKVFAVNKKYKKGIAFPRQHISFHKVIDYMKHC